jgi:hypothetical protein
MTETTALAVTSAESLESLEGSINRAIAASGMEPGKFIRLALLAGELAEPGIELRPSRWNPERGHTRVIFADGSRIAFKSFLRYIRVPTLKAATCEKCGEPFPAESHALNERNRRADRKFCSNACRQAAYRRRQAAAARLEAAMTRIATAYHEAGHAVVLRHFGLPVTTISLDPDGDSLGRVEHPNPYQLDIPVGKRRRVARQMMIAAYAGLEAERLVNPKADPVVAEGDEKNAFWLSREFSVFPRSVSYLADETHVTYLENLKREARRLIRSLRPQLELTVKQILGE